VPLWSVLFLAALASVASARPSHPLPSSRSHYDVGGDCPSIRTLLQPDGLKNSDKDVLKNLIIPFCSSTRALSSSGFLQFMDFIFFSAPFSTMHVCFSRFLMKMGGSTDGGIPAIPRLSTTSNVSPSPSPARSFALLEGVQKNSVLLFFSCFFAPQVGPVRFLCRKTETGSFPSRDGTS